MSDDFGYLNTLTNQTMAGQDVATALLGPFIMGWVAHFLLYGCMTTNAFNYAGTNIYRHESLRTKLVFWAVVVLDTMTVSVDTWQIFFHSTTQHRDARTLFVVEYADAVPIFLLGAQSIIVQIYLARRAVGLFSHKPILRRIILFATYLIATVAYLANTGAGIFGMFYSANISTTYGAINFNLLYGIFLWLSAATDIILTGALVYSLRRHIIGFSDSTDSSLRRIINLAMRTAAFTSFISTLGAIFSTSFPSSQISTINALFAFTSPLGSLYALSLVATLASKRSLADGDGSGPKHTIRAKQILSGIHVQHEVVEAVDLGEKEEAPSRRMWQKDHSKIEVELEAWGSPSSRKSDQE